MATTLIQRRGALAAGVGGAEVFRLSIRRFLGCGEHCSSARQDSTIAASMPELMSGGSHLCAKSFKRESATLDANTVIVVPSAVFSLTRIARLVAPASVCTSASSIW